MALTLKIQPPPGRLTAMPDVLLNMGIALALFGGALFGIHHDFLLGAAAYPLVELAIVDIALAIWVVLAPAKPESRKKRQAVGAASGGDVRLRLLTILGLVLAFCVLPLALFPSLVAPACSMLGMAALLFVSDGFLKLEHISKSADKKATVLGDFLNTVGLIIVLAFSILGMFPGRSPFLLVAIVFVASAAAMYLRDRTLSVRGKLMLAIIGVIFISALALSADAQNYYLTGTFGFKEGEFVPTAVSAGLDASIYRIVLLVAGAWYVSTAFSALSWPRKRDR